jgi:hypothetical protein
MGIRHETVRSACAPGGADTGPSIRSGNSRSAGEHPAGHEYDRGDACRQLRPNTHRNLPSVVLLAEHATGR